MDEEWKDAPSPHVQYEHYEINPEKTPKAEKKQSKKKKGDFFGRLFSTIVLAAVFGIIAGSISLGILYFGGRQLLFKAIEEKSIEEPIALAEPIPQEQNVDTEELISRIIAENGTVAGVAQIAMPSVVAITSVSIQEIPRFFGYGFGFGYREYPSTGSGSGIIVGENDEELLIATNNHVIEGAKTVSVCFIGNDVVNAEEETINMASGDGDINVENAVSAKIKGTDPENDLAVISVLKKDIPEETMEQIKIARIGSSDDLMVGSQVVAIGNALGYGQSVTSGWISALNRSVSTSDGTNSELIQTDAAINPGNSGGALLNMRGELIGINSAKYADETVEGMGYAIPISKAKPILEELMNRKTREIVAEEDAAYMGVQVANLSSEAIQMYNMPVGAFIVEVTTDEAAEKAGLRKGDIIIKMDGQKISGREELIERLQYYEAGETVEVIYERAVDGEYQEFSLDVTFGKR